MRYTTIIDITEDRRLYANKNARLVYLHLVLTAGYHDDDRDEVKTSLRMLAAEVGITLSATRHALKVLSMVELIAIKDGTVTVKKWLPDRAITRRPRNARERSEQAIAEERQRQADREAEERGEKAAIIARKEATGKTQYQEYIERLEAAAAAGDEDARRALARHKSAAEAAEKENKNKNRRKTS